MSDGSNSFTSVEPHRTNLMKSVYSYSIAKNLRRFNKWMPRLKLFTTALEDLGIDCQEFRSVVDSLDLMMEDSKKVLDDCVKWAGELDSKDWEKPIKEIRIDVVPAEERDFREWIEDLASIVSLATPYATEFLY